MVSGVKPIKSNVLCFLDTKWIVFDRRITFGSLTISFFNSYRQKNPNNDKLFFETKMDDVLLRCVCCVCFDDQTRLALRFPFVILFLCTWLAVKVRTKLNNRT